MKMPNMGNSFVYFRHSSVPGVNSFKMVGVTRGLIPDRLSEPARCPVLKYSQILLSYTMLCLLCYVPIL